MNDSRDPYPTSSGVPGEIVPGEIAAGGVVWRTGEDGVEVLLVHRPKYGDWTFPKGKVENGESVLECAIREVWEEAGVTASMGCYLGRISYYKEDGVLKVVDYWAMRADDVAFEPSSEVDRVRWLPQPSLAEEVSYSTERAVVARLQNGWRGPAERILLTRHAIAGVRGESGDDDSVRPLSERGRWQARALVDHLRCFDIDTILTSRATRCRQTVAPLAEARGLTPEISGGLWEEASTSELSGLLVGRPDGTSLLCSHRPNVQAALHQLLGSTPDLPFEKGSTWVFDFDGARLTAANYLAAPS
ncbi:MAG: NUDIX hydrolase [bacterium]|nr:NUDIX hydrolase [bacterium]